MGFRKSTSFIFAVWLLIALCACSNETAPVSKQIKTEQISSGEFQSEAQGELNVSNQSLRYEFNSNHVEVFNKQGQRAAAAHLKQGIKTAAFEDLLRYQSLPFQQQLKTESPIQFRSPTSLSGWYEEYEPSSSNEIKKTLRVEFDFGIVSLVHVWQGGELVIESQAEPSGRYSQITRLINRDDNSVRMLSTVEGQDCTEMEHSDYFFEGTDMVERRYRIRRDACSDQSDTQMWIFFEPSIDAAVPPATISESIEIKGCQRQAKSRTYYPNGQLKANIEIRDGLVLEEKRYNERGRRQSNPMQATLNEIRTNFRKTKCNVD